MLTPGLPFLDRTVEILINFHQFEYWSPLRKVLAACNWTPQLRAIFPSSSFSSTVWKNYYVPDYLT